MSDRSPIAWGCLRGIGLLMTGLVLTFLMASMLQWRAEARREASALVFSDPSLVGTFASAIRRAPPRLTTGEVLFTPELVAGR